MSVRGPTQLLVSVRSATEAQAALAGGADILDIKEPARGSLGMAESNIFREILATVADRTPVSVALGDLIDANPLGSLPGVTWAKLGYRPAEPRWNQADGDYLLAEAQVLPARLIPAFYVDADRVRAMPFEMKFEMLRHQRKVHSRPEGVLLDTAIKDGRGLLSWMDIPKLREVNQACHDAGLFLALAGSLSLADVKLLMDEVQPDILAVRGAACEGQDRHRQVSADAVAALKALIRGDSPR